MLGARDTLVSKNSHDPFSLKITYKDPEKRGSALKEWNKVLYDHATEETDLA